ncbi:Serine/threonine-protein kinase A [Candidatus Rubidus massiliensis]|nr:Serine/threonine-protein kinase A [Candidatus Rubidus massiliensis]
MSINNDSLSNSGNLSSSSSSAANSPLKKTTTTASVSGTAIAKISVSTINSNNKSTHYKPEEFYGGGKPYDPNVGVTEFLTFSKIQTIFTTSLEEPLPSIPDSNKLNIRTLDEKEIENLQNVIGIGLNALQIETEEDNREDIVSNQLEKIGIHPDEVQILLSNPLSYEELRYVLKSFSTILKNTLITNENELVINSGQLNTQLNVKTLLKVIVESVQLFDNTSQSLQIKIDNHSFVLMKDLSAEQKTIQIFQTTTFEKLGTGTYGDVYSLVHLNQGSQVVAKVAMSEIDIDLFNEVKILNHIYSNVDHPPPGISLPQIGFFKDVNYFPALILHKYDGSSLNNFFKTNTYRQLPLSDKLKGIASICEGVRYLHSIGVIHGDIKPRNILVNKQPLQFFIADFGGSINISDEMIRKKVEGKIDIPSSFTLNYATSSYIEDLKQARKEANYEKWTELRLKADIFALGLVIFKMLTGKKAYPGTASIGGQIPDFYQLIPKELPKESADILLNMLNPDYKQREGDMDKIVAAFTNF